MIFRPPGSCAKIRGLRLAALYYTSSNSSQVDKIRRHRGSLIFGCGAAALWGSQSWLPPAFSRRTADTRVYR
jgi:hypothetical protein